MRCLARGDGAFAQGRETEQGRIRKSSRSGLTFACNRIDPSDKCGQVGYCRCSRRQDRRELVEAFLIRGREFGCLVKHCIGCSLAERAIKQLGRCGTLDREVDRREVHLVSHGRLPLCFKAFFELETDAIEPVGQREAKG